MDENTQERSFGEVAEQVSDTESEDVEEQVETESEGGQDNESEEVDNQSTEEGNTDQSTEDESQEPALTEKGTKLDPNPQSAVHQQLANERRTRTQMEQVLSDPKLLAQFAQKQYGINVQTQAQPEQTQEVPTTKKWTAKDFENIDDVADKFNQLQEGFTQQISERDKQIQTLAQQVVGVLDSGRMRQVAESAESDVTSLRALPELNPKSPDFIEGLEVQIANLYHSLDFDQQTGQYRGNYSIKELGQQFVQTARQARKAGVQKGQTIIQDRSAGTVRTSPKGTAKASRDSMSPGASIAQGIAEMFK